MTGKKNTFPCAGGGDNGAVVHILGAVVTDDTHEVDLAVDDEKHRQS